MRKSNLLSALSTAFAGAVLALVMAFSASVFTTPVRAEEEEADGSYWCAATPPIGCAVFGCFARGDGVKKCKFMAIRNGADCATDTGCVRTPLE